jgi:hypothetical protein
MAGHTSQRQISTDRELVPADISLPGSVSAILAKSNRTDKGRLGPLRRTAVRRHHQWNLYASFANFVVWPLVTHGA